MEKAEALRAIDLDQLEYIQRKIKVDFDNRRQQPVNFRFAGYTYPVSEVVCSFRMDTDQPANGYLVKVTDDTVFCLYSQLAAEEPQKSKEPASWVLSFRIYNDVDLMSWYLEERKMLANLTLKRVVDFHGHICPELAVGGKFCEFVQGLFNNGALPTNGFSILCENTTSALDAIQVLLGATVGNQRLVVMDFGKHTYTLFTIEEVHSEVRPPETASIYVTCAVCGEMVLAGHSIKNREMTLCTPCFQKMSPDYNQYGMQ